MNLVLYGHPEFLGSRSHGHFARMLREACLARGHAVVLRQPEAIFHRHASAHRWLSRLTKWAGYIDQYIVFPRRMRTEMRSDPAGTLYVFCDQALGPWIVHALGRPHVVHCHDLMALRSALGEVAENPTALSGRIYQRFIRRGFRGARHFISVSHRSREELHRLGGIAPVTSEVVYNGLNHPYRPVAVDAAWQTLRDAGLPAEPRRCVLHVGGGQWYKNGIGVVGIYAHYARRALQAGSVPLPLWMVSPTPGEAMRNALAQLPAQAEVRFVGGLDNATLEALYSHAAVLLFPSLAEGFGWPIAEALACGCPVITTGEPPMTEVGGGFAHYLPRLQPNDDLQTWAEAGATLLNAVLARPPEAQAAHAAAGIAWAARFDAERAIDQYLAIYQRVLATDVADLRGSTLPLQGDPPITNPGARS